MADSSRFHTAVKWSFVMSWGAQGGTAVAMLVLASLLGPAAFGIVALANVAILFLYLFVDPGITSAVVQRRDLRDEHLDTAFWGCVVVSWAVAAAAVAASGWWAGVNDIPELAAVLSVLAISLPFKGLTTVQQGYLQRHMDFRALALRRNVSVILGGVTGISLALAGFGVWSLVVQHILVDALGALLVWRLSPWRPGFRVRRRALSDLLRFAGGILLSKVGLFAAARADAAVIGIYFGPAVVGIYRLAWRMMNLCVELGGRAVHMVSLSEFSRRQDDPAGLRRAMLQSLHIATLSSITLLAVLAAVAGELSAALGDDWAGTSLPLRVLCVAGVVQTLTMLATPLLQARGRPYKIALLAWIWGVLTVLSSVLVGRLLERASVLEQSTGMAAARAAVALALHLPVYAWILRRFAGVRLRELLASAAPSFAGAGAAVGAALLLRTSSVLEGLSPIPACVATFLVVSGAAVLALLGADPSLREHLRGLSARRRVSREYAEDRSMNRTP